MPVFIFSAYYRDQNRENRNSSARNIIAGGDFRQPPVCREWLNISYTLFPSPPPRWLIFLSWRICWRPDRDNFNCTLSTPSPPPPPPFDTKSGVGDNGWANPFFHNGQLLHDCLAFCFFFFRHVNFHLCPKKMR